MSEDKPAIRRYRLFPRTLAASFEPTLKTIYRKHGFAEHRILTQWSDVVGSDLARHSAPLKITYVGQNKAATLHVSVAGARALELQHLQPVILERIATYFGYQAIGKIKWVPAGAAFQPKYTGRKPPRSERPDHLSALAETATDPELAAALRSLGRALATVEK